VFSDDDEWVADNFRLRPMTQVRQSVPHVDLILLSRCRHHIMANSTFSWWGAWLCPYQDKVVIGPTRWVKHMETPEVMPAEWLCVTDPKVRH